MQAKDLQARQGNVDIVLDIVDVENPREFNKFGKSGRVANAKAVDETGQVKLSLWNEQIDVVKPGTKVHITNGYVSEWQGELQLTTGKFGKLEVIGKASITPQEPKKAGTINNSGSKQLSKEPGFEEDDGLDSAGEDVVEDDFNDY